jgi:hypothetical protein
MKAATSIRIASVFNTLFFFFHIPFYWMLDWENSLACLSRDNWAIFHCFNIISIVLLGLISYVSIFCASELLSASLGKAIMIFASWFYFFRIAAEFFFFEPQIYVSPIIIVLCAVPAIFYAAPLFSTNKLTN